LNLGDVVNVEMGGHPDGSRFCKHGVHILDQHVARFCTVSDKEPKPVSKKQSTLTMKARKAAKPALAMTRATLKGNAILNGLDASEAAGILERGRFVDLETRATVYEAEEPIREVYFPIDSVLSVVTQMKDGGSIEVGTIGRDGVSAIPLMLGATTSANECYCQVPGRAVVISAEHFQQLLAAGSDRFRRLLDRFLQAYVNMLGQLAACNGMHNIYERTARWLLMTHDRVDADEINLTHEFLAMMLGARRSGVTIAAATLQQAGFIQYAHGRITMLDRTGLEEAACECYEVARKQFAGLLRSVL
jgi:CRP-like cAMP-binding protein